MERRIDPVKPRIIDLDEKRAGKFDRLAHRALVNIERYVPEPH